MTDEVDESVMDLPEFETVELKGHLLSNKAYDVINALAMVIFPGIGTLYAGLDAVWGLPATEKVVATIVLVDTFLGLLLKLASASYKKSDLAYDGDITIRQGVDGKTTYTFAANGPLEEMADKDQVTFKIK